MLKGSLRLSLVKRLIELGSEFPEAADEIDDFIESFYQTKEKSKIDYSINVDEFNLAKESKVKGVIAYRNRLGVENIGLKEAKEIIETCLSLNRPLSHREALEFVNRTVAETDY